MKVAIIGAGAIGSLLAAKLSLVADVWLISGWLDHVQAIQTKGLHLIELDGTEKYIPIQITTTLHDVGSPVDLAIISVKSPKTILASKRAASLVKAGGLTLSMQNGIGNIERMATILGAEGVIQGVISHGATILAPGQVRHAGAGTIHLATRPKIMAQIKSIQSLFQQATFQTQLSNNLESILWGKLIINVGINALTAILNVSNGVLVELESTKNLMDAVVAEAVQVANAKGIQLPYRHPQKQVAQVALATAANRSSMLADVTRGVLTEIEVINGVIVTEGESLGIKTPVNKILVMLIKAIESSYEKRL